MIKKWNKQYIYLISTLILTVVISSSVIMFERGNFDEGSILIADEKIFFEVAKTDAEHKKGLSGREKICDQCGMLFVFDVPGYYSFWMDRMLFNIDIVWIRDKKIVFLSTDLDHEKGQNERVMAPMKIDSVLEVPAGFVRQKNLHIGQKIEHIPGLFE